MTKARKSSTPDAGPVAADAAPVVADAAPVVADAGTIRKALDELGIDRPFYTCRVVGNRLEFALYGGEVVCWPQPVSKQKQARGRRKS